MTSDRETDFWDLAAGLMAEPDVEEGTLMGSRCLRVSGEFLATFYRKEESLIVKLDAERAAALIAEGRAVSFAPAGKTFREWVAVPGHDLEEWEVILAEGLALGRARA